MGDHEVVFSSGLAQVFSIRADSRDKDSHVSVSELIDCDLYILSTSLSFKGARLSHTNAFIGPCKGTVELSNCKNCMFTVACKELVLRDCHDCIFYLYCSTNPKMTECGKLKVAPFNASWPGLGNQFRDAGLEPSSNYWNQFCNGFGEPLSDGGKANLSTITPGQVLDKVNNKLTDFGILKLREAFDKYDEDKDDALSWQELQALQQAIKAEDLVQSREDLGSFFFGADVALTVDGALPFEGFCKLYSEHPKDVVRDLALLGINLNSLQPNCIAMAGYEFEEDPSNVPEDVDEIVASLGPAINPVELATMQIDCNKPASTPADPTAPEQSTLQVNVADSSKETTLLEDLKFLFKAASAKGVDVMKWFVQFETGNQRSLSMVDFEKALTGLLLGLCLANSTEYESRVSRVLDKEQLFALQQQFPDQTHPGHVHYRRMVLRVLSRKNDSVELPSPVDTPKPTDPCASMKELEDRMAPQLIMQFENFRELLQQWRWSTNSKLFSLPSSSDDAISRVILASSLVNVFEMIDGTVVSLSVAQELVEHLQDQYETAEESKCRHACFHDEAVRFNGEHKDKNFLSNLPNETISISALLRWANRIGRENGLTFEGWKKGKEVQGCVKSTERMLVKSALEGEHAAVERLFEQKRNPRTAKMFSKYFSFPPSVVKREVDHEVKTWLASAVGKAAIRKRVVRNTIGQDDTLSNKEAVSAARTELVEEKSMERLKEWTTNPDVPFNCFLLYAVRAKSRGEKVPFLSWLDSRSDERLRSTEALRQWTSGKVGSSRGLPASSTSAPENCVVYHGLARNVESKVRSLFQRTFHSHKQSGSADIVIRRSSRYPGLDPDTHLAKLRKRDVESRRAAMEAIPGSSHYRRHVSLQGSPQLARAFISHEEFLDEFRGVLQSLRADPHTSQAAKEFLSPVEASRTLMAEYIGTEEGQKELKDLLAEVVKGKDAGQEEEVIAMEAMRQQLESEIRERIGFNITKPDLSHVTEAAVREQQRAQQDFLDWFRKKSKRKPKKKKVKKKVKRSTYDAKISLTDAEKARAFISAGDFMDDLQEVLQSFRTELYTSPKELLNPNEAAKVLMEEYTETDQGQMEMKELLAETVKGKQAREMIRRQLELEIRKRIGLMEAAVVEQQQTQQDSLDWLRKKSRGLLLRKARRSKENRKVDTLKKKKKLKKKNKEFGGDENSSSRSTDNVGVFKTHDEFLEEFHGILMSLRTGSHKFQGEKESDPVKEIDPIEASTILLRKCIGTDEGQRELNDLLTEVIKDREACEEEGAEEVAREMMRQQLELEIRERIQLAEIAERKQQKTQQSFLDWLRKKSKGLILRESSTMKMRKTSKAKSKKKVEKKKKKSEEYVGALSSTDTEQVNKSLQFKRPMQKHWEEAYVKNKYYSKDFKINEWVLRPRPEASGQLDSRPEWVGLGGTAESDDMFDKFMTTNEKVENLPITRHEVEQFELHTSESLGNSTYRGYGSL